MCGCKLRKKKKGQEMIVSLCAPMRACIVCVCVCVYVCVCVCVCCISFPDQPITDCIAWPSVSVSTLESPGCEIDIVLIMSSNSCVYLVSIGDG